MLPVIPGVERLVLLIDNDSNGEGHAGIVARIPARGASLAWLSADSHTRPRSRPSAFVECVLVLGHGDPGGGGGRARHIPMTSRCNNF
jgi:hypothetical protein